MAKLQRPQDFIDSRHLPSSAILARVGRLAVVAASIEDYIHSIHWKIANLNESTGPVITIDLSPNRLMEDIINLGRAARVDKQIIDDLVDIFSDYRPLATKRNQCVHWT